MSSLYAMPGHLIRRLQQISTSVFADRMKEIGLDITSPQFATLHVLAQNPGVDQATLAGFVAHDRPTIGAVLDRLVAKGFVKRDTNPQDRRAKRLSLTEEGHAVLERITPVVARMQDEILPGLTEEERSVFRQLSLKIVDAGNQLTRAPRRDKMPTEPDLG